jgi:TonB-linked SusC/RagA family outer membrane protein
MRNRLRNGIYSITNPFIMTRFLHTVVNPVRRIPPGVIAALWCCFLIGQTIPALAQERTVQGRVLSEDRVGFPGVNIIVKGTAQGTVTDADGNYSIAVSSVNDVLVFSSIGYETVEVVVGNRSTIDVDMVVDVKQLDEVVVVGYGTVKKSDVTGSLVSVTSDVIKERPVQNVLQALQGRAAGMHVTSNFKPGELPVVRIRGNRSLNASNDPLYVVDGIPLISGNISDINPNDIASIEVLKDASATAIYGSRGANGVVLITTNKGAKGKVSVNVNSTYSLDSYHSLTDWMNGGQYIDRWRESLMNGGLYSTAQFTDLNTPVIRGYPDPDEDISRMQLSQDPVAMESVLMGYEWEDFIGGTVRMRNTTAEEQAMGWPAQVPVYNSANIRSFDWIDQVTRQGITQSHQISLTSGTESSRLYLSLGYYDQLGVQRDQDYERFNTTVSGDITANNWLTLGASLIGSFSLQNFGFMGPNTSNTGSKDLYSRATEQFPYALPRDADGRWNPIIDIDQTKNERRATSLMASLYAEIKFTPWLKYRMNFGPQFRHFRNGSWTGPDATSHLTNRPNTAGYTRTEDFSWVLENLLYADKTFGDHTIGVTLLQSSQESRQERIATSVTSTIYDISYWYDLAANLNGVPGSYGTGFTSNTLMSWMGRINYSFRDKYLLTASGRFDGASVLAEGHKWHFFPSLAVAWKLHEEEFMSFANAISELKPRFGFGVTGNSSVSPYTTTGPLSRNPYVFGSTPAIGYLPQLVRNPELEWEKTSQWNIGLDFGLFQNRLRGSLEIYDAKTNDLIMRKTLPAVSGYVEKLENVGKTRNRGIEITLSSVNIEKGDFTWTMDVNWSRNKEEIVELLSGKEDMLAQRWFIGQPLQVYYQYENAGIWQNTAEDLEEMAKFNAKGHRFHPGTIKVVDQNGDYVITADDMVIRGSDRPKWTGGITNTFRYKNWTLSSFIYARVGQTYFGGYPNSYGGVWPNGRVENDVWSWDNPGGKWPMPNFGNVENITAAMQYHDGSFYAVRNIAVSFDFPGSMIDRFKINSLQLSAQVVNPFIFGGDMVRMGINPDDETNWQIASSNTNPLGGMNNNTILPQSFVFGLRASF